MGSIWNGLLKDKSEYSRNDFYQYIKIYIRNIFKHPIRLAKVQWPIFKKSNGNVEYFSQFVYGDVNIYDEEYLKTARRSNYVKFLSYPGITVINDDLREIYRKHILLLEDTKSGKISEMCRIVYSCYIPLAIIFIYMIILLLTKKTDCFIFALFSIGRLPIVFITSPDSSFMYYYPNYIIGLVAASFIINDVFKRIYTKNRGTG